MLDITGLGQNGDTPLDINEVESSVNLSFPESCGIGSQKSVPRSLLLVLARCCALSFLKP